MRNWSISEYTFLPKLADKGLRFGTDHDNLALAEAIVADHMVRSDVVPGRVPWEYRIEDFGDELRVYVLGRKDNHWRFLVNLQFEGES